MVMGTSEPSGHEGREQAEVHRAITGRACRAIPGSREGKYQFWPQGKGPVHKEGARNVCSLLCNCQGSSPVALLGSGDVLLSLSLPFDAGRAWLSRGEPMSYGS